MAAESEPRSLRRTARGCTVAADEVLQHVYERPSHAWRLVVVDLRRDAALTLPVCVRLPGGTLQELLELPTEEELHFCLVDTEDVSELLAAWSQKRSHVCMVEGGWQALETLILALNLELLAMETQPKSHARAWGSRGDEMLEL